MTFSLLTNSEGKKMSKTQKKALWLRADKISIVFVFVMRRPFTNCGSFPDFLTQLLISFPPPCTITGLKPTDFSSTTSWMTCFFSASSTIAVPLYFTTMIFLLKR